MNFSNFYHYLLCIISLVIGVVKLSDYPWFLYYVNVFYSPMNPIIINSSITSQKTEKRWKHMIDATNCVSKVNGN